MKIALFCATRRGLRLLKCLRQLAPTAELTVFSFREDPSEPPFFDSIRQETILAGGTFVESRRVQDPHLAHVWNSEPFDLAFAVSWRYRIPREIYNLPKLGTFVFHDSLLPEYRGFSPTVWAIANGEDHTGATLFRIAEDIDSGAIVDQRRVEIGDSDHISLIMERVTQEYLVLLEQNLDLLLRGDVKLTPQDHSRATYACKRAPSDNLIDWSKSTREIFNLIRAVGRPYAGAYTFFEGRRLRIWAAEITKAIPSYVGRVPGRLVRLDGDGSVFVLTGSDALRVTSMGFDDLTTSSLGSDPVLRVGTTFAIDAD